MGIQERKIREKEQRKTMIIDCAMQIFAEKGIAATSMEEIATCAELSKATLYLYFKNKEELVIHGMLRVVTSFVELLCDKSAETEDNLEKLHKVGEAYLQYYRQHPHYYQLLNSSEDVSEMNRPECLICQELKSLTSQIWVIICKPINALIAEGVFQSDTNPIEMGMLLWAGSNGVIGIWDHVRGMHQTPEMLCMEAENPFLYQMNHLDFEQMLHRLWNSIIDSYLKK